MKAFIKTAMALTIVALAAQASAQVIFYESEYFQGRSYSTGQQVDNMAGTGFNDRASSVIVQRGRWEVCTDARFGGSCMVLRPGQYPSLADMGMNDRVSSMRSVSTNARMNDNRYAPPAAPVYDNRRRNNERLYQADVTSVRAVVGPPEQRCWVEREQVSQEQPRSNVPGAIAGALIGGILGHQVGGGVGKDLATVGGAIAGGAVGAQVGRNGGVQQASTRDVQRCTTVPSHAKPTLWDVSYNFRGQEHRLQMTTPPGATVTVNRLGEPRS